MKAWPQWALAAVCLPFVSAGHASERVVLRLKNSGFEFSGELKSFDGRMYVVAAPAIGLLSLDADRFDCEGDACTIARNADLHVAKKFDVDVSSEPALATAAATIAIDDAQTRHEDFVVDGSAIIGQELMPELIRDYARSLGGAAKQVIAPGNAVQFRITDARGSAISSVDLKRRNSADAFGSLIAGRADIGMSSRPITSAEAAAMPAIPGGVHGDGGEVVLGLDALAVLVAPENPAKVISIDALAKIASGRYTNWSQLGLPAAPIKLYAGSQESGAGEGLDELVLKPRGFTVAARATRMRTEAELSDAVARDPRAVGIASLAFLRNARPLAISDACGISKSPSVFAVKSEEYPLSRRLYLYSRGLAKDSVARGLLKFASSRPAQTSVKNAQFIDQSIEEADFTAERGRFDLARKSGSRISEAALAKAATLALKGAKRLSTTLRFASGSSQLDAKARDDVARLTELLKSPAASPKTLIFVGYTDSIGSAKANRDLSYRRADQIRDAVMGQTGKGRLAVVLGHGAIAPVACDETADGQRLNRRVEVWLRD